jgi:hypothetical protein
VNTSQIERLQALLAEMSCIMEKVAASRETDRLAVFIYQSRRAYKKQELTDTKSGKRCERLEWASYVEAQHLGFKGSLRAWQAVLWS